MPVEGALSPCNSVLSPNNGGSSGFSYVFPVIWLPSERTSTSPYRYVASTGMESLSYLWSVAGREGISGPAGIQDGQPRPYRINQGEAVGKRASVVGDFKDVGPEGSRERTNFSSTSV